ncbi:hypothetical protein BX666DRAFT_2031678 [Dichotomocladium elegans]|nr:hypothetical protein BX666DRAFT_2031678 [Dichotomocladium elegans]
MRWNDKNLFFGHGKENALCHDRSKVGAGRKLGPLDVNLRRQQQQHIHKRRTASVTATHPSSPSGNFSPEDLRSIRHHLRTNLTLAKRRMMARLSMSTAQKDIQMYEYLRAAAAVSRSSANQQKPPTTPVFSSNDDMPPPRRGVRATELFYPHGGWSDSLLLSAADLTHDTTCGNADDDERAADDMMADLLNLDTGYCS